MQKLFYDFNFIKVKLFKLTISIAPKISTIYEQKQT